MMRMIMMMMMIVIIININLHAKYPHDFSPVKLNFHGFE